VDFLLEFVDKVVNQVEQRIDVVIAQKVEQLNPINPSKPYMNKKEAAKYLSISYNTLQKFIANGLPVIEVDNVKLLSKKDIDSFLEKYKQ